MSEQRPTNPRQVGPTDLERNEAIAARIASGQADSGTATRDAILITGNGEKNKNWAGDTVSSVAAAWLRHQSPETIAAMRQEYAQLGGSLRVATRNGTRAKTEQEIARDWIVRVNNLKGARAVDCEGDYSIQPEVIVGDILKLPEGNEVTDLLWARPCPLPVQPETPRDATPPRRDPQPPVEYTAPYVEPTQFNGQGPEWYSRQPTTPGINRNGLINAYEILAATGQFPELFEPGDIAARPYTGAWRTADSGMDGNYHRQGRQGVVHGDQPVAENPTGNRSRQGFDGRQGAFAFGNPLDTPEAQARFLDGDFTGDNNFDLIISNRGPGATIQPRDSMLIGNAFTTTSGAQIPTFTVSQQDKAGRDIWWRDNKAAVSGPLNTHDEVIAYGDFTIANREFARLYPEVKARLEAGDPTLRRDEVQNVLNVGNYIQRNVLVRGAGAQDDMQVVLNDLHARAGRATFPATDASPALVLRDGRSLDILDVPLAELGGGRLRIMSTGERELLEDRWNPNRFEGYKGIENQEFSARVYEVAHRRPNTFEQYIANNRATLVAQSPQQIAATTDRSFDLLFGSHAQPNVGGVNALLTATSTRSEIASSVGHTLVMAYNNPELFGMSRGQVNDILSRATGGDRAAGNEVTDGNRTGYIPNTPISGVPFFADSRGALQEPELLGAALAANAGRDPALAADIAGLLRAAPEAQRVLILHSLSSQPSEAAYHSITAAAGLNDAQKNEVFLSGVQANVYSRTGYTDVAVSAEGRLNDWLTTYESWQANGRQGAAPTVALSPQEIDAARAAGSLSPELDALLRSNNAGIGETLGAVNVNGIGNGDMSATRNYLRTGMTDGAAWDLFFGDASVTAGTPALIAESMQYNPAFANNLMVATLRTEPRAFNNVIGALRERAAEYRGTGFLGIGNASRFDDAANALQTTSGRLQRIDERTWERAAAGDRRAVAAVERAYAPWNDFMNRMSANPTSRDAHLRYAAFDEVFDTIGKDPASRGYLLNTAFQDPQFREAAVEMLALTPMQRQNMREQTLLGKGRDPEHAIPQAVTGPAINASAGRYVASGVDSRGRVTSTLNIQALAAGVEAHAAAAAATAAAANPHIVSATQVSPTGEVLASEPAITGNALPPAATPGSVAALAAANGYSAPADLGAPVAGSVANAVNQMLAADSGPRAGADLQTGAAAAAPTVGVISNVANQYADLLAANGVTAGSAAPTAGSPAAGANGVTAGGAAPTAGSPAAGANGVTAGGAAPTAGGLTVDANGVITAGGPAAGANGVTAGGAVPTAGSPAAGGTAPTAGNPAAGGYSGVTAGSPNANDAALAAGRGVLQAGVVAGGNDPLAAAVTVVTGGIPAIVAGIAATGGTLPGVPGVDPKWVLPFIPGGKTPNEDVPIKPPPFCVPIPRPDGQQTCTPGL